MPSEILDHIDVEAEWDPTLEPEENLRELAEKYPSLKEYLPMFKVSYEDIINEVVDIIIDAIGDDPDGLKTLLNNLATLYYKGHKKEKEKESLEEIYLITGIQVNSIDEFTPYLVELIDRIFDNMVEGSYFIPNYEDYPSRIAAIKQWMKYRGIYQWVGTKFREKRRAPITDKRIREYAIECLNYGNPADFEKYLMEEHPEAIEKIKEAGFKSVAQFYRTAIKSKTIKKWAEQREKEKKVETQIMVQKPRMDEELRMAFKSLGLELLGVGGKIVLTEKGRSSTHNILIVKDESSGIPVEILYPIPKYVPSGFYIGAITNKDGGVWPFPMRTSVKGAIPEYWMSEEGKVAMLTYVSGKLEEELEKIRKGKLPEEALKEIRIPESDIKKLKALTVSFSIQIEKLGKLSDEGEFVAAYVLINKIIKEIEEALLPHYKQTELSEEEVKNLWESFSKILKDHGLYPEIYRNVFEKAIEEGYYEDAKLALEDYIAQILVSKESPVIVEPFIHISKRKLKKYVSGKIAGIEVQATIIEKKMDLAEKVKDLKKKYEIYRTVIEKFIGILEVLKEVSETMEKDKEVWRFKT